jgi:hypothetical protein
MTDMRRALIACAVAAMIPWGAFSAEPPGARQPDYSREALLLIVHELEIGLDPAPEEGYELHVGAIDLRRAGSQLRLHWLPFLAPLYGTAADVVLMPLLDPILLAGAVIPGGMEGIPAERLTVRESYERWRLRRHVASTGLR